jgi:hypothetical protein
LSDYSQHLDAAYLQLQQLRDAAKQGELDRVAEIAKAVDWEAVASEFESVAMRYSRAVYRHGRRIMRNLLLPYITYHDCIKLDLQIDMLRSAIEDSPSLLTTATEQLESAYQREPQRRRGHEKPATLPWPTIETLIDAANAKIQRGRELEAAGNADFIACGRVYLSHDE